MKRFFFLAFVFLIHGTANSTNRRIVSLAPNLTEIIYALDLGNDLVGDTRQCDYPQKANGIEKVGDYSNPSLEKILQLQPTVVIATEGNPRATVEKIEYFGIAVIKINPHSIDDLVADIQEMGLLFSKEKQASLLVNQIHSSLEKVHKLHWQKKSFLIVLQSNPIYSASPNTWISDLFQQTGAENILKESKIKYPIVSPEFLLANSPDFVFYQAQDAPDKTIGKKRLVLPKDVFLRAGPRVVQALDFLTKIHP